MEKHPIIGTNAFTIEQTIQLLGGFKLFQWLIVASFSFMGPPRVFQLLMMVFGAHDPTWRCMANSTVCLLNGTIASSNQARCHMPRSEWDYTVSKDYSITTEYDLVCDRAWMMQLMNSITFVGWGIGAVILGYIADNYGRKKIIYPAHAIVLTCGFLFAFVKSLPLFVLLRFVIGFFIQAVTVQSFVLVSEYVPSKSRAVAALILFVTSSFSSAIFTIQSYYITKWRLLGIIASAPYFVTLLSFFYVPESIRWLRLKGTDSDFQNTLKRIAHWNKTELTDGLQVYVPEDEGQRKHSILDIFRGGRASALRSMSLGFSWLACGMVYYSFIFAAGDIGASIHLNVLLYAVMDVAADLSAMGCCNKFGRKRTVIGLMSLASVCCLSVAFIPIDGDNGIVRIVFAMIGYFSIGVAFSSIYVWSVEIYPTTSRSNAMGFLQLTSRIGAASAPWVAKGLVSLHTAAPYLVMGVTSSIASFLLFFLPETKGRELKETNRENQVEKIVNKT